MRFLTAAFLFATLLLVPIAAFAQTPPPAKSPLQKVSIQVTFVTVKTEDLDALGINFDLIPLPASPRTFIAFVEGNIAAQLYQTLTRAAALVGSHTVALAPITVSDNVPAVFTVNTQVPMDAMPLLINQGHSGFPQLTGSIQLRGKVTLIPQIVPGNLVTLDMLSPIGSQRMRFRTIPSGQQVVMDVAVVKAQDMTGRFQSESLSGRRKILDTTELLIFITPMIVTKAPETISETTTVVPPTRFLGIAAGSPFAGTTFGGSFPGDASSGLLGFGPGRPSDALQSTHWLGSLHWPGGSNIDGTIGRPNLVNEAPPLPSGVIRIYAL